MGKGQDNKADAHAWQCQRLNLEKVGSGTWIYRIMSVKRLFELFEKRQNVLVSPACWDDPFENFILRSSWRMPTGETGGFAFQNDFYGQCWTLQKSIGCHVAHLLAQSDGVRIRTSIDRLASSLAGRLGDWAHVQSYIGKVQYLGKPKMRAFASSVLSGGLNASDLARTLLVKRPAFRHERDVRLLYFEKKSTGPRGMLYSYSLHSAPSKRAS